MAEVKFDNLILIDIGANLTHKKFNRDLDSVVNRAKQSGYNIFYFITKPVDEM